MATTTNGSREQQAPPPSATDVDKTYPFGHSGELGSLTTNETSISTAKRLRQRLQRQQSGQSGRSGVTGDELLRVSVAGRRYTGESSECSSMVGTPTDTGRSFTFTGTAAQRAVARDDRKPSVTPNLSELMLEVIFSFLTFSSPYSPVP